MNKSSANCFHLSKNGPWRRAYYQYHVDPRGFYKRDSFILTNLKYCLIVSHKQDTITSLIESLNNAPSYSALTDERYISNYIGVNIKKNLDGTFKLL